MRFFDQDRWNEIWETISRNKRRSVMTALGVFWGIYMLIVLMGGGLGLGRMMLDQMGGMSTNTAFMFADQTGVPYKGMPAGRWWEFYDTDVSLIKDKIPGVQYAAGMSFGGMQNFTHKDRKGEYNVMGYTPEYIEILPQPVKFGRYFNEIDMLENRKVCVIGIQVWKELFPAGENPVGEMITINGMYLTVIGVIERGTAMVNFSGDPERTIAVPNSFLQQLYNLGKTVHMIALMGKDDADIAKIQEDARQLVMGVHLISPDDVKAINAFNLGEEFDLINGLFRGINLLTWIVGLGTLLAGIVGVSNIMLVVVRERTQEIGVRRALGAPPSAIISQIISESFILTFIAGIIGLAAGVGTLSLVDMNFSSSPDSPDISWQISFGLGMASAGIIILGSILAGLIPANRALKIKAVDAIREE